MCSVLFKGTWHLFFKAQCQKANDWHLSAQKKLQNIHIISFSKRFRCTWGDPEYDSRGWSMPCVTDPRQLSSRTQAGSSFSIQFLEEDFGFKPEGWRVNTAAQDWASRESIFSHVHTFLFSVLAMVRWAKPQCHVFSMNCNSIQWDGFSCDEVSSSWKGATELTSVSCNKQQLEAPRN